MWKSEHRRAAERRGLRYPSDLTDAEWALVEPMIPPAKRGGRRREVNVREVLNAIFYVLSTGCQWQALPKDPPPTSAGAFDERVRELVVELPALAAIVGPLLAPRGADTLPSRGRWTRRAIECLRKALRAAPDCADAMFNLALLLQRKNQYPEAADYWRRYLASDSRSDWATRARRSLKFCEMQSHLSASA